MGGDGVRVRGVHYCHLPQTKPGQFLVDIQRTICQFSLTCTLGTGRGRGRERGWLCCSVCKPTSLSLTKPWSPLWLALLSRGYQSQTQRKTKGGGFLSLSLSSLLTAVQFSSLTYRHRLLDLVATMVEFLPPAFLLNLLNTIAPLLDVRSLSLSPSLLTSTPPPCGFRVQMEHYRRRATRSYSSCSPPQTTPPRPSYRTIS